MSVQPGPPDPRSFVPTAVWRQGGNCGKNLYAQEGPEPSKADRDLGRMDTELLAGFVTEAVNHYVGHLRSAKRRAREPDTAEALASRLLTWGTADVTVHEHAGEADARHEAAELGNVSVVHRWPAGGGLPPSPWQCDDGSIWEGDDSLDGLHGDRFVAESAAALSERRRKALRTALVEIGMSRWPWSVATAALIADEEMGRTPARVAESVAGLLQAVDGSPRGSVVAPAESGAQTDLTVGGEDAVERLLAAVAREAWIGVPFGVGPPSELQVAMVLHALAHHAAIMRALTYSRDYPQGSGVEDQHWPDATSIGRWFHGVGDAILTVARLGADRPVT